MAPISTRSVVRYVAFIAMCTVLAAPAFGQDLSRYRSLSLGANVDTAVSALGLTRDKVHTLHERPARIQQLEWLAPYVDLVRTPADPVRSMTLQFYNDALYQILVAYDASRTDGMTDADLVEALSTTYGAPLPRVTSRRVAEFPGTVVLAKWESSEVAIALLRSQYGPDTQLLVRSTMAVQRARVAIQESLRLDAIETPRREAARLKQSLAEEAIARDRLREANRSAFRP